VNVVIINSDKGKIAMFNLLTLLNDNKKIKADIFDAFDRLPAVCKANQPSELMRYAGQIVQHFREVDGDDYLTIRSLDECLITMNNESQLLWLLLLVAVYNCGKPQNERVYVDTGKYMLDYNPVEALMKWITRNPLDLSDLNMIRNVIPNFYLQTE